MKLLVMENHLQAISKETALTGRWVPLKKLQKVQNKVNEESYRKWLWCGFGGFL